MLPGRRLSPSRWAPALLASTLLVCSPGSEGSPGEAPAPSEGSVEVGSPRLGEGFVVWETDRSGDWRLWTRRLDGSGLRRLTTEQGDRQHCCAHVSPDGRWIVYMRAQPEAGERYPDGGLRGPLHLVRPDGTDDHRVVDEARGYGDHRAAVWTADGDLVFIGESGRTELLDVETEERRVLIADPPEGHPWLVDATLRWATSAYPSFSPYDGERRAVAERSRFGGCEPYFTHDGRWGYWIAGAGGPLHKIDLATREVSPVLDKNDPRLPADRGYFYFPMVARSGQLLAFGASGGGHDHYRADYDLFVVETDPETLELLGEPVRMTAHPGSDRFPDVFVEPLPLGRRFGEAPLRVELEAPDAAGDWRWDLGDGTELRAPRVEHVYREPGSFSVIARSGGRTVRGRVTVRPPRPPAPLEPELRRRGLEVVVPFDEAVDVREPEIRFASGRKIAGWEPGEDGRSLVVTLAERLDRPDRLLLAGAITDRSDGAHRMEPAELQVQPPLWPVDRRDLVFLWQHGNAPNLVRDERIGQDRACTLEPRGRARLDHAFRMVLGEGLFAAEQKAAGYVRDRCEAANQVSLEATFTPDGADQGVPERPAWIVSFGRTANNRNLALGQAGRSLVLRVRTPDTGRDADRPQLELFELPTDRPTHVVVTYGPGILRVYRDGERVLETDAVQGGLGPWKGFPLTFGDDERGGHAWSGTLEGVALYSRVLDSEEVRESALRYRAMTEARPEVPRVVLRGRVAAASEPPTLREISPYRRALFAVEYRVEEVQEGSLDAATVRVAHWAILDGETQPVAGVRQGERRRLVLEPFDANPQLEGAVLEDDLAAGGGPLFYAVESGSP